jgi:hypothetical protein
MRIDFIDGRKALFKPTLKVRCGETSQVAEVIVRGGLCFAVGCESVRHARQWLFSVDNCVLCGQALKSSNHREHRVTRRNATEESIS